MKFFIVDWNSFPLESAALGVRLFFKTIECELAREFTGLDLKGMLRSTGFGELAEWPIGGRYERTLAATNSSN